MEHPPGIGVAKGRGEFLGSWNSREDKAASNPGCRDFEGGHPSTVIYQLDPQNAKPMDAAAVLAAFPETMSYTDAVALAKASVVESHTRQ